MAFYDYQTSVLNSPVYNTEEHILEDKPKLTYNSEELEFNMADMWQGAVHGKGGSIVWLWDREGRTKNGTMYFNSLLSARPEHVAALGKLTLDLNRLAEEIVSVQDAQANVGILYSLNGATFADDAMSVLHDAYVAVGESGQKVKFVVE